MNNRDFIQEEHPIFQEMVTKFLREQALPHHEKWEKQGFVDRDIWLKAGELGILCPQMPETLGGLALDFSYNVIINEAIFHLGLTGLGFGLHNDIVVPYLLHHGSEEQQATYFPKMQSGEWITAIAMTEPGAGSDLQNIRTTAIRQGDHYIINGSKTFITNGQHADLVLVACKTDPNQGAKGTSLIWIEADSIGFTKGKNLEKIGLKAQDTSELFFQDVKVPVTNLLGEEGKGFHYMMQELSQERLHVAISAMASCEAILQHTVDYVQERTAFGKPIAALQNTQFILAQADADITCTRIFIDHCIKQHLAGQLDAVTAAKAKLISTELNSKIADDCLQLFGGYGYMWEYPVARAFADARVQRIYAGTNEIMKLIIARKLLEQK